MKQSKRILFVAVAVTLIAILIIALTKPKKKQSEWVSATPGMGAEKGIIAGIDLQGLKDSLAQIQTSLAEVTDREKESQYPVSVVRNPLQLVRQPHDSILREGGSVRPQEGIVFLPTFTVSGILYDEVKPLAIIDGEVRTQGEAVAGYRVVKIAPEYVDVERAGRAFRLFVRSQDVRDIPAQVVPAQKRPPSPANRQERSERLESPPQSAIVDAGQMEKLQEKANSLASVGIPVGTAQNAQRYGGGDGTHKEYGGRDLIAYTQRTLEQEDETAHTIVCDCLQCPAVCLCGGDGENLGARQATSREQRDASATGDHAMLARDETECGMADMLVGEYLSDLPFRIPEEMWVCALEKSELRVADISEVGVAVSSGEQQRVLLDGRTGS